MIIGIAGRKGHGKTTIANALADAFPGYKLMAFADPIRAFAEACGFDLSRKEEPDPRLAISPRRFMQTAGTEFGRSMMGEDFWVNSMAARAESSSAIVIHDVRFPNERNWIRERGGCVLWIHRPAVLTRPFDPHASENSISQFDCDSVVINDDEPWHVAIKVFETATLMGRKHG
jgi:hypothetical protein